MKAHVVYATITGNNEDIADIVTEGLEDLGMDVEETEISQTEAEELTDTDLIVICPYTYDEGNLPEEGMDFFEDLGDLDLTGKVFGVAGSGDVFYEEFYNLAVDKFAKKLLATGATQGAENVKINLDPDENDIKTLDQFSQKLFDAVNK
ncbi:flavodoxin [Fructilactobacillus sanfranciscensis]|uniref:Flavodoxin n=1 Tax=Fructilactobacillus sanfranciscensis TaxID=1625 RepID=A0A5C4THV4_FRUSA|nr:flavodoxin [Fructilactobacillus sanfranciscensis]MCG7196134.1 flavodoxin [Fructilactobacillus sanfranciscensis]MDN4461894.1 flavodoxin [Fructilactobacillus sanfranciscensis]MVF16118.1 flavodoxin [Fructilactobacillus sanfranciscensis]NDR60468.1 flavodoxin [Fructilactobacillus sanfranciscensis]NDR61800.1 flavodoxin [Fructilactobacillus sanfranciscensis]